MTFDPSGVGQKGSLFGFSYALEDADLVILPVPWDVTTSYQDGTAQAPEIILEESVQLDFSLKTISKPFEYPVAMCPISPEILKRSNEARKIASEIILDLEEGNDPDAKSLGAVNGSSEWLNDHVKNLSTGWLEKDKVVGCLGGDHSGPLGLIQAIGERHSEFGILQIDAHMDLRKGYEGFIHSHASIMYNALQIPSVSRLVQVGIRDYCEEELAFHSASNSRVITHFDEDIQKKKWTGNTWPSQVDETISDLPDQVYISFDLDGLDPSLCPNTGTPVPGGLSYYEAVYLIEALVKSGRKIIGFDISECGPQTWDANVASRLLYRLSSCVGVSRGRLGFA